MVDYYGGGLQQSTLCAMTSKVCNAESSESLL